MVTVPPVMLASVRLPAVSLNRTLPEGLDDPKEVTVLLCVLRSMAPPAPLTTRSVATIAPV